MKKFLLTLTCLLYTLTAVAQVKLSAFTDKTDLALDDELTLTVQVSGISGNMIMPQLPSLPAFNVYSRDAVQSTINGKTTLSFRYTMMPRFVGTATIGAVTFKYVGKTYQTEPITVRIYKSASGVPASSSQAARSTQANGTRPAQVKADTDVSQLPPLERELATRAYAHAQEPFFMVAAVSNKTPYVNEPFTLAVRFYYSRAFYDAPYQNPAFTNLLMEEGPGTQGQQTINHTLYRYEEKRYRLTGVSAGEASIGAASVSYREGSVSGSLFDRFFGGAAVSKEETVSSKPIRVTVRPLPANKPASFYGAVGSGYSLTAKLDRSQTEAGEAATFSVTVQGPGNLKTTSDVSLPEVTGLTSYPAAPVADYVPNHPAKSYKVFKTVYVPASSGTYTIPAVAWSYFDPQTHAYQTVRTRPLTLEVSPASHIARPVDFGAVATASNGVQSIGQDIHYVKPVEFHRPLATARLAAWKWAHFLAFVWVAVCVFMASIGKKTAAKKHAYTKAKAALKKARIYEDVSDALAAYLLTKWQISTARLPLKDITAALDKRRVSADVQAQFSALWKELESARFAPTVGDGGTLAQLVQRTQDLLKQLEAVK